jgi:hypothetical protein
VSARAGRVVIGMHIRILVSRIEGSVVSEKNEKRKSRDKCSDTEVRSVPHPASTHSLLDLTVWRVYTTRQELPEQSAVRTCACRKKEFEKER